MLPHTITRLLKTNSSLCTDAWQYCVLHERSFRIMIKKSNPIFSLDGDWTLSYGQHGEIDPSLATIADVKASGMAIDGKLAAESDNMFIPLSFALPELTDGTHEILVHFTPAAIRAREIPQSPFAYAFKYNSDSLYVRKAPSQYGWDIMPRAVSAGIWKHVYIDRRPAKGHVTDLYMHTIRVEEKQAVVHIVYDTCIPAGNIRNYRIKITAVCGDSVYTHESQMWHTSRVVPCWIGSPKLWWPHNYGEPNLYDVTAELYCGEELVHSYTIRAGIRDVKLDRTSTTDKDGNGEFCFLVNGKKIFAMGTNWVPVDTYHSRDEERLPQILPMLSDIGCNIVRCWGGNVYENDIFYDYCDEHGIMVWQDFAMACAIYPQDKWFLDVIEKEATAVVKMLRNHPSIVLWAGDNECDCAYVGWSGTRRDPNKNLLTRQVLPEVLRLEDWTRPYLPSSPYIDEHAFQYGGAISEDHLWGPRDYFKGNYYKNTVSHFASETGYHGCPSPESLAKYISPEQLWPCLEQTDWLCHAACMEPRNDTSYSYRIKLMWDQVETLFGKGNKTTADLETFSQASQISQAEAKKYFIERFRLTKWRRSGIIWWNLIDGWPQISDAIVDYYLDKKLAYWYIKNSQQPVCMMFDEPVDGMAALYAVNDTREDKTLSYKVLDDMGNVVIESTCMVKSDTSVPVWHMPVGDEKKFYTIQWTDGTIEGMNHYFTNIIDIDYDYYVDCAKKAGLPLK